MGANPKPWLILEERIFYFKNWQWDRYLLF